MSVKEATAEAIAMVILSSAGARPGTWANGLRHAILLNEPDLPAVDLAGPV